MIGTLNKRIAFQIIVMVPINILGGFPWSLKQHLVGNLIHSIHIYRN